MEEIRCKETSLTQLLLSNYHRLGTRNIEMKKKKIPGQKNRQDGDTCNYNVAVSVGRGIQRLFGKKKPLFREKAGKHSYRWCHSYWAFGINRSSLK